MRGLGFRVLGLGFGVDLIVRGYVLGLLQLKG